MDTKNDEINFRFCEEICYSNQFLTPQLPESAVESGLRVCWEWSSKLVLE